jgi:hypothetical protein
MLRFFPVDSHGRRFRTLIAMFAILLWISAAPLVSQVPVEFQVLLPELATKIAAAVGANSQVRLVASVPDSSTITGRRLEEATAALLASHGVRVVNAIEGLTTVQVSCSENLRERSCVATVQNDAAPGVILITRPHDGAPRPESRPAVALELRSLVAQRTPILDVAHLGERLLVLDAASVALYRQEGQDWERASSRPLPPGRVWPRDLRGRLSVEDDDFKLFLPGITCSGRLNQPTLGCAEGRQAWPLGLENNGVEPGRNHFSTAEGVTFYNAATLGVDSGARWLIADRSGTLSFLDSSRQLLSRAGTAEDVVGVAAPCAPDTYVIAGEPSEGQDALRLFQVVRQRLIPVAAPVFVTGKLTALWAAPGANAATAIAHDVSSGRYEAFLVSLSCGR